MLDCIFCQIAAHNIPSTIIYEDEQIIAFEDIDPQAPVHVLIVPKKHIASMAEITNSDLPLIGHMMEVANIVARQQPTEGSFKLVINTGAEAGQAIMHLHMHLLAGKHFNY